MKKQNVFGLLLALALVSCQHPASSVTSASSVPASSSAPASSVASSDVSSSVNSSSSSSSSEAPIVLTYHIVLPSDTRYTITSDKTTAKQGETVTLTATAGAGYAIASVLINKTVIAKSGDHYVFAMPDHDVKVTATLTVTGDVTLGGDIAAALSKDSATGIYSVKGVAVDSDANFSYFITGTDGARTELNIQNVDRTKCFADITFAHAKTYQLLLAGGAKYDFFYDPSADLPCYVKRSEVTSLPSDISGLEDLFDGSVLSSPSVYPDNVNHVEYTNTASDESYVWNKLSGNKSLAKVTKLSDSSDKALVYKALKDNLYTVVDTYTEGVSGDVTKTDDTKKFSGRYAVSKTDSKGNDTDDIDINYGKEYMHPTMASFDLNLYSHDMHSIDFDIMYSYRVAMTKGEEITQADCKITSTKKDEGFETTIVSSKTYDASAVAQDNSTEKYHDEYAVTLDFDKAGAITSGTYLNTHYDEKTYDYTNFKITGEGKVAKQLTFAYSYGDPADDLQPLDTTPYFISSLAPTVIDTSITSVTTGNRINQGTDPTDYLTLNFAPATALDSWQYQINETSDASVIGWNANYVKWNAYKEGSADLTIRNNTTKDVSAKITVQVLYDKKVRNFVMYLDYGYEGYGSDEEVADRGLIYEKHTKRYRLAAYDDGGTGSMAVPADTTLSLSETIPGLVMSVVPSTVNAQYTDILFDATNMKTPTDGKTVTLTVNTAHYATSATPTTFTLYLFQVNVTEDTVAGTWVDKDTSGNTVATLALTKDSVDSKAAYYSASAPYYGSVTVGATKYEFGYLFNETSVQLTFTVHFASGTNLKADMFYYEARTTNGTAEPEAMKLALWTEVSTWDGQDSTSTTVTDILGTTSQDEDDNYYASAWAAFSRVSA
jgi:hypothetical protein